MAHLFNGFQPQAKVGLPLPGIQSFVDMSNLLQCQNCNFRFSDPSELLAHRPQCRVATHLQQQQQPISLRHDSMHSAHSSPTALQITANIDMIQPSSSSSAASDSDQSEAIFTPNVSRASSMSRSHRGSRRTSKAENRSTRRQRRQSSARPMNESDKKSRKTEKEKLNRSNQAAVTCRYEDLLEHYCGWTRNEQSGGNGNSAGLVVNKINLLRAYEAVANKAIHKLRCDAIREGRLADLEQELQSVADAALEADYRPWQDTFMELPPGELPCSHEDTKSKECSVHNHPDWRECRKTRSANTFRPNEDRFIASLGLTREQALYGSRAQSARARPNGLPIRSSRR